MGFKSPLSIIAGLITATDLAELCTLAGGEFLRTYAAGSIAENKVPTGLTVRASCKLTFFPIYQTPCYVRVFRIRAAEYPRQTDRSFATDYTTQITNDGTPDTFDVNDSAANNITTGTTNQTYFQLPWVNVSEMKALALNWKIKKMCSFKIGPELPVKTVVFKTGIRNFEYTDLDFAGVGTPAAVPKWCDLYAVEVVGENVVMDTVAFGSASNTNFFFGPSIASVGFRQMKEFVYRPTWSNRPEVNQTVSAMGVNYKSLAPTAHQYPFMTHPARMFGISTNSSVHPTAGPAIVGTQGYGQLDSRDFSNFVQVPIRQPGHTGAGSVTGQWDHGLEDRLTDATQSAILALAV
jgi:hypothetical protein